MSRNLTTLSQGASEFLFLFSSDFKSHIEGNLDLVQYIFLCIYLKLPNHLTLKAIKQTAIEF